MAVEAHMEEEKVRGVNLNGGRVGGVDLNGRHAVEAHTEEERGAQHEPRRRTCGWRGPRRWAHAEEE
jgi:hypothetical protein